MFISVFAARQYRRRRCVFGLSVRRVYSSVRPSVRPFALLPLYLMTGLSNLDETHLKNSLPPIDDLLRFWRLKVKVVAGWRRHPRQYFSLRL